MTERPSPGRSEAILTSLSRRPRKRWPDAVTYHGARLLVLFVLALLLSLLFAPGEGVQVADGFRGLADVDWTRQEGFQPGAFAGSVLLNAILLGIFGLLLYFFRPRIYHNFRWILLQALLIAVFFGAGALVDRYVLPVELLPVAFVTLTVAVLWDGRIALFLALVLGTLAAAQPPFAEPSAWMPVLVAGAAAALSVRVVRRRAQTWVFIALIVMAYGAILAALGLALQREPGEVASSIGWAGVNTIASAILAMGFLPLFEWLTRITTDQTLLEWADPNRSLLKRLSLEAPGTYAHTINVANLAEAAANAVGANGLLCRVGVYYHDVGKMVKPQYFIENQLAGRNPHDKLKPETSAAIVREHVTEGVRLAQEEKVPELLVDFIREHHGTQRVSFFSDRAQDAGGRIVPDDREFRYPGPKPRSRETAIVMLADSVESATRAMKDPTPDRISQLIDNLVETRLHDGQLDDAPITLQEIGEAKRQFRKVLGGMYHHRIDYPGTRHLTEAPGEPEKDPETGGESETRGEDVESPATGAEADPTGGGDDGATRP